MEDMTKTDKRIIRTKSSLHEALCSLLMEKPSAEITVKELAEKADINRKTFYIHYESVDDVLNEWFWEFVNTMTEEIKSIHAEVGVFSEEGIKLFVDFMRSEEKIINDLMNSPNVTTIMIKVQSILHERFSEEFSQIIKNKNQDIDCEIIASFIAGGVMSTYYECVIKKRSESEIDEMCRMLSVLILNALSSFI